MICTSLCPHHLISDSDVSGSSFSFMSCCYKNPLEQEKYRGIVNIRVQNQVGLLVSLATWDLGACLCCSILAPSYFFQLFCSWPVLSSPCCYIDFQCLSCRMSCAHNVCLPCLGIGFTVICWLIVIVLLLFLSGFRFGPLVYIYIYMLWWLPRVFK